MTGPDPTAPEPTGPEPRGDPDPAQWADPSVTYDAVAPRYADRFLRELDDKPFDRELLARFARSVTGGAGGAGPVCDLGCGPGHVASFLADLGADVIGCDRSRGMVAQARLHRPSLAIFQGDMSALGLRPGSLGGVVCFYALIHIPRVRVPDVIRELHRVLALGGSLLLAVHGGTGSLHATQMLEQPVELDATLFVRDELAGLLEAVGLTVVETHDRDPYAHEVATRRLYLWATRRV